MTSTALVGPLPTVAFYGGPMRRGAFAGRTPLPRVVYEVPRNTCDPRFAACTDHHVACDCREACHAEEIAEHRAEWKLLHDAAHRALAGHQVQAPIGMEHASRWLFEREQLCLCSGCVIHRATGNLLGSRAIDWKTGRVHPAPVPPEVEVPF